MKKEYHFDELKNRIKDLPFKAQLKKLVEARTDYKQNVTGLRVNFEVPFDEKCDLEIEKIRELMKIEAL
jgi:hypothetical protein